MSITLDRLNLQTVESPVTTPVQTFSLTVLGGMNEKYTWTTEDVSAPQSDLLDRARERFNYYHGHCKYAAYTVDSDGEVIVHAFTPGADTLLLPQIVGG